MRKLILAVCSLAFGFALYCFRLGPDAWTLLHPKNVNWLLQYDWAFSFFSLQAFLRAEWSFPLGSFDTYLYSLPNNLLLGDSLPLWSVLIKLWLGPVSEFLQFTGLWLLVCSILQVHASFLLARLFYPSLPLRIAVTASLSLFPAFLQRTGHPALCAHFFILYALFIAMVPQWGMKKRVTCYLLLLAVAAGIHPYFVPMLGLLLVGMGFVRSSEKNSNRRVMRALALGISGAVIAGLVLWVFGAQGTPRSEMKPVSFYISDVMIYLNSMDRSVILPALWKPRMGQVEGFNYLGLGACLFFLATIFICVKDRRRVWDALRSSRIGPVLVACLVLFIWSWGENVRFFGQWLLSLHFLYEPFYPIVASFRAAGRFAWVLAYVLLLLMPLFILKFLPFERLKNPLILFGFFLQFLDIGFMIQRTTPSSQIEFLDKIPFVDFLKDELNRLVLMPPDLVNTPCRNKHLNDFSYIPLAFLAQELNLGFNSGNRANPPLALAETYCRELELQRANRAWKETELYVFHKADRPEASEQFLCIEQKDWVFCRLKL